MQIDPRHEFRTVRWEKGKDAYCKRLKKAVPGVTERMSAWPASFLRSGWQIAPFFAALLLAGCAGRRPIANAPPPPPPSGPASIPAPAPTRPPSAQNGPPPP